MKDIETRPDGDSDSIFGDVATVGEIAYFAADDGIHGYELWRTDGTSDGTWLVHDIDPGGNSSLPRSLTALGSILLFTARHSTDGCGLWRSDGTAAGTFSLAIFQPSPLDCHVEGIATLADRAVFAAHEYVNEFEDTPVGLWKTDGTVAGTERFYEFGRDANVTNFVQSGGLVFFIGNDALWKTDGTVTGTRVLSDVDVDPGFISILFRTSTPFPVADGVVFPANDGEHGIEMWKSDGTEEGTSLVRDIAPGPADSLFELYQFEITRFGRVDDLVLFSVYASTERAGLWRTDGTENGTLMLHSSHAPAVLGETDRFVFFTPTGGGDPLWRSDGTVDGTRLVRDLDGMVPVFLTRESGARVALGTPRNLFFSNLVNFENRDCELWSSDGTPFGTHRVKAADPGSANCPSEASVLKGSIGNDLLFSWDDGVHGRELWRSDGIEDRAFMVRDINDAFARTESSRINLNWSLDDLLLFRDQSDRDGSLWRSDGTEAGTYRLTTADPDQGIIFNHTLLFAADTDTQESALWRTDGTLKGTERVAMLRLPSYHPRNFTIVGDQIFFASRDEFGQDQLWRTDGTSTGTLLVADTEPIRAAVDLNGVLIFFTEDGALWSSDGTREGTWIVTPAGNFSAPTESVFVGDKLIFNADSGAYGRELWVTDGASRGVRVLKDIVPGPAGSWPHDLVVVGGRLYFFASTQQSEDLWTSDGTNDGTHRLHELTASNPYRHSSLTAVGDLLYFITSERNGSTLWVTDGSPDGVHRVYGPGERTPTFSIGYELAAAGKQLFFFGDDGISGPELWVSDGSTAGTRMVRDIDPRTYGFGTPRLTVIDGRVFVWLYGAELGREPWISDGSNRGTVVLDLAPGPLSSNDELWDQGSPFFATRTHVYFTANDGKTGSELWAIPRASGQTCHGDCNHDSAVGVDELVVGVAMSIGTVHDVECAAFDTDGNHEVGVDELVLAVKSALAGCRAFFSPATLG